MGSNYSKQENKDEEAEVSKSFDVKLIHFDDNGNLRYGTKSFNREGELKRIMDADDPVEEDGKIWYIINSAWLASWLQYAHTNKNVSPNPGPCRNECLLTPADDSLSWIGKEGLVMGSKAKEGDYRRVSKETWEIYCDLYPNSGPAIYVEFYEDLQCKATGLYDTSKWVIDKSSLPAPPVVQKKKKIVESVAQEEHKEEAKTQQTINLNSQVSQKDIGIFFGTETVNPINPQVIHTQETEVRKGGGAEGRKGNTATVTKVQKDKAANDNEWLFKENMSIEM